MRTAFNPKPMPRMARQPTTQVVSDAVTGAPVGVNPYTSPIPHLVFGEAGDARNISAVVTAIAADVESLIGLRGDQANRAVTFKDLVSYGIISEAAISSTSGPVGLPPVRPTVTSYSYTPADPVGTSSATGVMMGLGIEVNPGLTGALLIGISGAMQLTGTVGANIGHVELRIGADLGAIPANGAAPSGLVVGTPLDLTELGSIARHAFAYITVSQNNILGSSVWLDIMLAVSAGDVALFDLNIAILGV